VLVVSGRIKSGVKEDIVALTEIPGVRGYRARLLYKAGLRTPEAVAACDISKLTDILVAGGRLAGSAQESHRGGAHDLTWSQEYVAETPSLTMVMV
jgi:hypothetical protein